MQHLEEGTIHAWLDGELSAAEQAQAERHVAECADCAAAVAEARGMIAGASRIVSALDVARGAGGGGVLPRQSAKPAAARSVWHSLRLTPTRAALAASLLVAAGALLTARHDTADKMTPFAAATAPAPQIALPSSAGPVPASDAAASPKPTLAAAMNSTAARAPLTVTKKPEQQQAGTGQPSALADAKRGDSAFRREVQAANAIAPTSASVATAEKAAAPPPSAPASNVKTPISAAVSAAAAAGAVVADRRSEPARALDSLDKTRPDTVRAAPESRRQAFQSSPLRLENVAGFAQSRFDIAGCYQIKPDSSAVSRLLPNRFALLRPTGTADSNVVRAVTPDGRMDSVVTGINWVQISNGKTQIRSTVGNKHQVANLQLTSLGGVSGQATTPDGTRLINVTRAICRP